VEEGKRVVADQVQLPEGVYLEWTGQFLHEQHAETTLLYVVPLVLTLIGFILYLTYHDKADALLMLLAVRGRLLAGLLPVAVRLQVLGDGVVGYIAVSAWRPRPGSSCWSTCARRWQRRVGWKG